MTTERAAGYIGPGLVVHGRLSGEGDLIVDGGFEGELSIEGRVAVGPAGRLKAPVTARLVTVEGRVDGDVTAAEVVVREGGRLHGDVRASSVGLEDGGALHGTVTMDFDLPADLD
ncbi:MAG: polymer-forming cytoskeletal protein [Sandaracinus sp.]|nr:polymer-forming cytoskeletal protein [Sandaracinus sp.]MCB9632380.1 polymer-forming cytoskeletal protein [Sandaracinus sp.]